MPRAAAAAAFAAPLLIVPRHLAAPMFAPQPPARAANPLRRRRTSLRASGKEDNVAEPTSASDAPYKPLSKNLRRVLGGLSLLGAAETLYLTYTKLQGGAGAICATEGCLDVLTGPFSAVFGIPISAFGFLAYATFAALSLWPLGARAEERYVDVDAGTTATVPKEEVYNSRDAATRAPMLAVAACMAGFSTYLMSILAFVIRDFCPYCAASAAISAALFITTLAARSVRRAGAAARGAAGGLGVAAAAAVVSFAWAAPMVRIAPDTPQAPPEVTARSSPDALRIASKLKTRHTRMYGAYWCSHCFDQKQRLGKKAWAMIEYVECDRHGVKSEATLCRQKRIPGYPTWEVNGKLYPGEIRLEDLDSIADEE